MKQPLYIYYVALRTAQGKQHTHKIIAKTRRGAMIKAAQTYDHADVASMHCPEGVPYTKENQRRELANKRRAKERKQKRLEQDIMRYDGLTPIYDETDE